MHGLRLQENRSLMRQRLDEAAAREKDLVQKLEKLSAVRSSTESSSSTAGADSSADTRRIRYLEARQLLILLAQRALSPDQGEGSG